MASNVFDGINSSSEAKLEYERSEASTTKVELPLFDDEMLLLKEMCNNIKSLINLEFETFGKKPEVAIIVKMATQSRFHSLIGCHF